MRLGPVDEPSSPPRALCHPHRAVRAQAMPNPTHPSLNLPMQVCIGGGKPLPPSYGLRLPRFDAVRGGFCAFAMVFGQFPGVRRFLHYSGIFRWAVAGAGHRCGRAAAAIPDLPFSSMASRDSAEATDGPPEAQQQQHQQQPCCRGRQRAFYGRGRSLSLPFMYRARLLHGTSRTHNSVTYYVNITC